MSLGGRPLVVAFERGKGIGMAFPIHRLRRLRQHASLRRMVRETVLTPADFIYPLFVTYGRDKQESIGSMPGQFRWSVDRVVQEAREAWDLGIPAVILFGIPEYKDERGSSACEANGVVPPMDIAGWCAMGGL
jgi:porphobilinogen synthase